MKPVHRAGFRSVIAAMLFLIGGSGAAWAEGTPSGRAIAERWCAGCHAIHREQTRSPQPQAPSFWEMSRDPSINERAIRALLTTPHASMPNIRFTHDELDEIAAYIVGLRHPAD